MTMTVCKVVYGDGLYHTGGPVVNIHVEKVDGAPVSRVSSVNAQTRCGIPLCIPGDVIEARRLGCELPDPPRAEMCPVCFPPFSSHVPRAGGDQASPRVPRPLVVGGTPLS